MDPLWYYAEVSLSLSVSVKAGEAVPGRDGRSGIDPDFVPQQKDPGAGRIGIYAADMGYQNSARYSG